MVQMREHLGVLRMSLRNVVYADEAQDALDIGRRCLHECHVQAMVVDIRGCKPMDTETFATLKILYDDARLHGVERFVRIGDGTLCAVQMHALERAADVTDRTLVFLDDEGVSY